MLHTVINFSAFCVVEAINYAALDAEAVPYAAISALSDAAHSCLLSSGGNCRPTLSESNDASQ